MMYANFESCNNGGENTSESSTKPTKHVCRKSYMHLNSVLDEQELDFPLTQWKMYRNAISHIK